MNRGPLRRESIGDNLGVADQPYGGSDTGREEIAGIDLLTGAILEARDRNRGRGALVVAITGIDGSGKGSLAARLAVRLRECGRRAVVLHADGWLNLPQHRFSPFRPAAHFYEHALRLDEMFERLVEPLRESGRAHVTAEHAEETASRFRGERYDLDAVDLVLLEGIFLLKRAHQARYDLSIWVNCSEETALERAQARTLEGLSPAATTAAYRTIYFPAQALHQDLDRPHEVADFVYDNDPRLGPVGRVSFGLTTGPMDLAAHDFPESRPARRHHNA